MQNIAPIKTKHWLILSLDSLANVVGKGPCGIARFEDYVSKDDKAAERLLELEELAQTSLLRDHLHLSQNDDQHVG